MVMTRLQLVTVLGALCAFSLLGSATAEAATCTVTWDGGAGTSEWTDGANWSGDSEPAPGDHVCIDAPAAVEHSTGTADVASVGGTGALSIAGGELQVTAVTDSVLEELTIEGGQLIGAGAVTVGHALQWTGGSMGGSGTTEIMSGATFEIDAQAPFQVGLNDTRTLLNRGTATWISGYITVESGLIENVGSFDARADDLLFGFEGRLHNTGSITRTAGAGSADIGLPIDNDGTITASTGEIRLSASDEASTQTGAFEGTGSGRVRFDDFGNVFRLGAGAAIGGRVTLDNGILRAGAPVAISGEDNMMNAGALSGPGLFTVTGELTMTGGDMWGPGATVIASTGELVVDSAFPTLDGRTLRIEGNARIADSLIWTWENTLIDNAGHVTIEGETEILGWGEVRNGGTLVKEGGEDLRIGVPLVNDGLLDLRGGTLSAEESFTQTADGVHRFRASGTTAGSGYGELEIFDGTRLNGTLDIAATPGFEPPVGTRIEPVKYYGFPLRNGSYSSLSGTQVASGRRWAPLYEAGRLALVVESSLDRRVASVSLTALPSVVEGRRAIARLRCAPGPACVGAYSLISRRLVLAKGKYSIRGGTTRGVAARLTRVGAKRIARRGSFPSVSLRARPKN